jgi:DNA-binding NarL/FixJ family response regulator
MWTIGHSRGVADLAEQAATVAGLPAADVSLLRQAALAHDVGRVAVTVQVWGNPGPLSRDQREPVPRPAGLSERGGEVLGLVARGLATKQVARQLGISPKTCDHHIQSVYGKIGVSTRAGATLFALEHGLVWLG